MRPQSRCMSDRIILPADEKFLHAPGIPVPLLESPSHRTLLAAPEKPAALRRPLTRGGSRHDESAHSVSGDGGGFNDPRRARIRRGHHDPGWSLLQTRSPESAAAGSRVQRDHGHSGGRDGERRAGACFQLPANQLREPGISAGIYDRLRPGITTDANANVVLPANATRSRASQSRTGPRQLDRSGGLLRRRRTTESKNYKSNETFGAYRP